MLRELQFVAWLARRRGRTGYTFFLMLTRKSRISCGFYFFFVPLHRNGEIRQDHQHHPGISSTRPARLVHRQRGTIVFVYSLKFIVYSLRFTVYSLQFTDDYIVGWKRY